MSEVVPLMIGTAGHVDHGKTTLLKALAGGAPEADRLPEEQERGLTIDIGYAELDIGGGRFVGFVDVPGHERFVRNMVAAASGIDLILLVVAADDGVMPQTREHLEIAGLMGATTGFAALTKIDLVDEDLCAAAEEEVRALLAGSFLSGAPIVRVSAVTGAGMDELRRTLIDRLAMARPRRDDGVFRMPVQRSFAPPGHGTVVTGVPLAGRVRVGDTLEVVPGGKSCRVRAIQAYHHEVTEGRAGHRTALKLSDLSWHEISRGNVVAEPGYLEGSNLVEARLRLLDRFDKGLASNTPVRFHSGTAEVLGRVFLLNARKIGPGEDALVQFRFDRPVVVAPGDRYVIRAPSPQVTLGGGRVIGRSESKISATRGRLVRRVAEREAGLDDLSLAVRQAVRVEGLVPSGLADVARETMRRPDEVRPVLERLIAEGRIVALGEKVLNTEEVAEGRRNLRDILARFHRDEPLRAAAGRAWVRERLSVLDTVLTLMIDGDPEVEPVEGGRLRLRGFAPGLSEIQQDRLSRLERIVREAKYAPPRDVELPDLLGGPPDEMAKLVDLLRDRGLLYRLAGGVVFHREALEEAKRVVADHIRKSGPLSPSDLKGLLGMSRKYSIPLLEWLDETRFTVRRGDDRLLA